MFRRPKNPLQSLGLAVPVISLVAVFTFSGSVYGQALAEANVRVTSTDDDKKSKSDKPKTPTPSGTPSSTAPGNKAADNKADKSESTPEMDARVKALEDKLDEMQQTILSQQKTIKAMSDKLGTTDATSNAASTAGTAAGGTATSDAPAAPLQAQSIEDRLKKVEEQGLRIGPVRISGDFRIREDGIFRNADTTPPTGFAALTHQQNVRARYRFRLNMDADLDSKISFHGQLSTGPINNTLTNDTDFGATNVRVPFFINEAWVDFHPNKAIDIKGGRVQEVFADNSKFLFDDDVRFNGFNETYTWKLDHPSAYFTSIEFRAGQYVFSNPNVAIVTAGSPLADTGAPIGSTGRDANLFHQGVLFNQKYNDRWSAQFGGDIQLYRNPNQIQLASTANGVVLIVQGGVGLTLSGAIGGTGNATTTNGGSQYTARRFQVARVTYRLNWAGWETGEHVYPVAFNVQASRNVGVGIEQRDAVLGSFQVGKITKRWDTSFLYIFAIKGANSMISQLTDDDLGTNTGVNIRTNAFRFELGLTKKITFQSWLYLQKELMSTGQFPKFFVPVNAFTPLQSRYQEQLLFSF